MSANRTDYPLPETDETNRLEPIVRAKIQAYKDEIRSDNAFYNWLKKTGSDRADWYFKRINDEHFTEAELVNRIVAEVLDKAPQNGLGNSILLRHHFREGLIEFFNISENSILKLKKEMTLDTLNGMSYAIHGYGLGYRGNAYHDITLISAKEHLIKEAYAKYQDQELVTIATPTKFLTRRK